MTVEQLIADIIAQVPNLAIAAAVLYWQKITIDKLLDHQRSLVDKLLQMVDDVREQEHIKVVSQPVTPKLPPE